MENKNERKDPKYVIPVDGEWVEVNETIYQAYYQPIWKARMKAQRAGECFCPKELIWKCDGVCPGCMYYVPKNTVSMSSYSPDHKGLSFEEVLTDLSQLPEFILLKNEMIDSVREAIHQLDPKNQKLCVLLMYCTQRQAARIMGIKRSAVRRRWRTIRKKLKACLQKDYL